MNIIVRSALWALILSTQCLFAQAGLKRDGGNGGPPPSSQSPATCPSGTSQLPVNTAWGYYQWQVDMFANTTTLTSETGFNTPPGMVQIPVTLACGITVHEVHGNFAYGIFQGGTCGTGTIIAQVLDQSGNTVASLDLIQFGQSSVNFSVKGTFATPLSVTGLTMRFTVPNCGSQVASWSLTMS